MLVYKSKVCSMTMNLEDNKLKEHLDEDRKALCIQKSITRTVDEFGVVGDDSD